MKLAIVYRCLRHLNTPKKTKAGVKISSVLKAEMEKSGIVR